MRTLDETEFRAWWRIMRLIQIAAGLPKVIAHEGDMCLEEPTLADREAAAAFVEAFRSEGYVYKAPAWFAAKIERQGKPPILFEYLRRFPRPAIEVHGDHQKIVRWLRTSVPCPPSTC